MKIGDEVYIHGYVDEIRSDVVIIRNDGGYFGTVPSEVKYDCDDCRHWWKSEDVCLLDNCHYEPKDEPLTCDGNCWMKKQNGEWLCEHCQRKPKTEPQKCYLRESCDHYGDKQVCGRCRHYNLYSHTKTESQPRMTEDDAFYIVFKDLTKDEGLFTGRYDAKHGSRQYMHGISSVMEYIAYRVGEDCYNAWVDRFAKNMIESQEKAERGE